MPRRRRSRKHYRKKKKFEEGFTRRRIVSFNPSSQGAPIPYRMMTKHRFYHQLSLNPGASALVTGEQFRANSIYNPYVSDVASPPAYQPMLFDQFSGLYTNFHVLGSKITARFMMTSALGAPVNCAIRSDDDVAFSTSWPDLVEEGRINWKTLLNDTSKAVTVTRKFSARKTAGVDDVLDEDDLAGNTAPDRDWETF